MKIPYKKLLNDFNDYVNPKSYCDVALIDPKNGLIPYYIDFEWSLKYAHYDYFDDKGVPLRNYLNYGKQYNPTRIAAYALVHWNRYIQNGHEEDLNRFMIQAQWFAENARERNDCLVWVYDFDYDTLKAPWISAMAQGEAISVLSRAFMLTNDDKFREIAEKSAHVYDLSIEEGGIKGHYPDGTVCFEEIPKINAQHILNGNNYTIIGLHDYCKYINKEDISRGDLLKSALEGLKQNLHNYDTGWWSLYHYPLESLKNPATILYHDLHIAQMTVLYNLTTDETFNKYAVKWKQYKQNLSNRMLSMVKKLHYRYNYPVKY